MGGGESELQAGIEDKSSTVTDSTGLRDGLEEPFIDPLTGHFNQSELGNVEDLGARLVAAEGLAKRPGHGRRRGN